MDLCPAHNLVPGERTGTFRLGKGQLLIGADGESRISLEDYAVAMIDELERPKHTRQPFTVAYESKLTLRLYGSPGMWQRHFGA